MGADKIARGEMKSILDPSFRYAPSTRTDLRKTFARIRRNQTFIVPLLAAAAVASSCATPDSRYDSNDTRYAHVYSNENMYSAVDAIEAVRRNNEEKPALAAKREASYRIRVRFDDRSYQTVTQDSLDGLRVGDSVRIERDRVRRY